MADVGMSETWIVNFSLDEFRLVLKALGGELKIDDIESAKKLGNALSYKRAWISKNKLEAADRLLTDLGDQTCQQ